jgi:hypothetical protein
MFLFISDAFAATSNTEPGPEAMLFPMVLIFFIYRFFSKRRRPDNKIKKYKVTTVDSIKQDDIIYDEKKFTITDAIKQDIIINSKKLNFEGKRLYERPWFWWLLLSFITLQGIIGSNQEKTVANNNKIAVPVKTHDDIEKEKEPMFSVTAPDIYYKYENNKVNADYIFKDKRYQVTGTVIDIDISNNKVLIKMRGGFSELDSSYYEGNAPRFSLLDSEKYKASQLQVGNRITLNCTGAGFSYIHVYGEYCSFL